MFRRLVIFLNLLSFIGLQNLALAATEPGRFAAYNDFLKETGATQRQVTLDELQEKYGKDLPGPLKTQMELFIKENPGIKAPKIEVHKVNSSGQEQLQITMNTSKGNLIFTTSNAPHIAYTVVGQIDGKEVKADINYEVVLSEHLLVYEERRELSQAKNPVLLSGEDFAKLTLEQKKEYIKKAREALEAAEAVQNVNHNGTAKVSKFDLISESFESAAFADENCIVAGWTNGTWHGNADKGICSPPPEAKSSGCGANQWTCNPALYGDNNCVSSASSDKPYATKNCGANDLKLDKVASHYTKDDPDGSKYSKIEDLKTAILTKAGDCPQGNIVPRNPDQARTCDAFKARIADLNKLACGSDIANNNPKFKAACNPSNSPVPAGPLASLSPGQPDKDKKADPSKDPAKDEDPTLCKMITDHPSDAINCQPPIRHATCGGKTLDYCTGGCANGTVALQAGGQADYFVQCKTADPNSRGSASSRERPVKEKSWWDKNKSWALPTAVFGGMGLLMYMQYRANQNYLNQQSQYYNSIINGGGSAPTVVTSPTTGIIPPPPVSRFQIPGVR